MWGDLMKKVYLIRKRVLKQLSLERNSLHIAHFRKR